MDADYPPFPYQLLPQTVYTAPNPAAAPAHVVNFTTPLGLGVNLQQAYMGTADSLLLAHEPAFSPDMGVRAKITIRIMISGYESYSRQVMALRATRAAESISLERLANIIAHEMVAVLNGQRLRVGQNEYSLDDILLVSLRRVSPGSWQPVFWIRNIPPPMMY